MYRQGLLVLGIILFVIGIVLGYVPIQGTDIIGTVFFWIGILLIILWAVLYAIATIKSGN